LFIVDLHQVVFSNFFAAVGKHTNMPIKEDLMRHMILNTLRAINTKFRNQYGEMIIASDAPNSWRKEYFPFYKAARKKARAKSDIDWKTIFQCVDALKEDIQQYFPYKFIQLSGAEADDVIAIVVKIVSQTERVLIVSGDKDFRQLHTSENIVQYDPTQKKWLTESDPAAYLAEHIIKGDESDGIPNVMDEDNVYVLNTPRTRMTKNRKLLLEGVGDRKNDKYHRNWIRNKTLIDFNMIPKTIEEQIVEAFNKPTEVQDRSLLIPYFMKHKLPNLIEHVNEF